MPYMISSQSVTGGLSLSVSKSKLVYSSLIFVDNKLTLICLLTQQRLVTVSVRNAQVIQLISASLLTFLSFFTINTFVDAYYKGITGRLTHYAYRYVPRQATTAEQHYVPQWPVGQRIPHIVLRPAASRKLPPYPQRHHTHVRRATGARRNSAELSATACRTATDICPVSVNLPSASKNISVPRLVLRDIITHTHTHTPV